MPSSPTPRDVMSMVAALLNDTSQSIYSNATILPYFNMATGDLQEHFQQNNIPVTNETSAAPILVKAGVTAIGFGTTPSLPGDLVEIQELYERPVGIIPWVPMTRKEFLPQGLVDQQINQLLLWSWARQEIRLIAATSDNELRLDYIANIFNTEMTIADIDVGLGAVNVKQYLGYRTASLCAMFIGENESRASVLNSEADTALERELGIPTKGRQANSTRRQPFMGSYRRRSFV